MSKKAQMTFTEWHEANAKYMEPADMVAWCSEAWMAGFDRATEIRANKEKQVAQDAYTKEEWSFNDNTRWGWKDNPYSVTCRKRGVHSATIAAMKNCASIPDTEKRANAMLICAAPDLLNALVDLLDVCYDLEIDDGTVKAVAYITKRKSGGTEGLLRADMVDRSAKNQETHDFIPLYKDPTPCQTCESLARTVMVDQTSHDTKKKWVGLTDDDHVEYAEILARTCTEDWPNVFEMIESDVKGKNT